ncbi:MAG: M24 family metallopeptidase [Firmicutes bacterium]|nr:M24 family metallopeptidase [Bacillota bacterium]
MQNREIKTEEEISLIVKSAEIIDNVFDRVLNSIKVGQTEIEIAEFIFKSVIELGGEGLSFDTIVAFGENGAEPHHVPTDRGLKANEFVTIDMGAKYASYCSDFTRTFVCGRADEKMKEIYEIVKDAMLKAVDTLVVGVKCFDVDKAARDYITAAGYGDKYIHGTGHGVGLEIHEAPTLNTKSQEVLAKNMVVTVEPGIYIDKFGGVRIENMYIVGSHKPISRHTIELIEIA